MSGKTFVLLVVVVVALMLPTGCEETKKVVYPEVEIVEETALMDVTGPEDFWEALDLEPYEYIPAPGEFLWPCSSPDECLSGFCVMTKDGGRCTMQCVEDCPKGWVCTEVDTKPDVLYICVPRMTTLCDPCMSNDDCRMEGVVSTFLDLCVEFAGGVGSFCGADCEDAPDSCPSGYSCQSVETLNGTFHQCLPDSGKCTCSLSAIQQEKKTECFVENEFGKCVGQRICGNDGLTACDAKVPSEEICDDQDNDCDGITDEGCDDDDDGWCDASMVTEGKPVMCGSGGGDCNDSDPQVFPGANELCDKKDNNCNGIIDDGLCDDGNPCTDDLCDPVEGCSHPWNDAPCDDLNACTENDHCFEGVCTGAPKVCDDGNPCTTDLCNPVSEQGCYFVNNSDECDDDGNPCTIDVCENGACQHKLATDIPCDDGDVCTVGDKCISGQCVSGKPMDCDDGEECTKDSCDPAQGCVYEVLLGMPCIYDVLDLGLCKLPGKCGLNGCIPEVTCDQCGPNCLVCVCCMGMSFCVVPKE